MHKLHCECRTFQIFLLRAQEIAESTSIVANIGGHLWILHNMALKVPALSELKTRSCEVKLRAGGYITMCLFAVMFYVLTVSRLSWTSLKDELSKGLLQGAKSNGAQDSRKEKFASFLNGHGDDARETKSTGMSESTSGDRFLGACGHDVCQEAYDLAQTGRVVGGSDSQPIRGIRVLLCVHFVPRKGFCYRSMSEDSPFAESLRDGIIPLYAGKATQFFGDIMNAMNGTAEGSAVFFCFDGMDFLEDDVLDAFWNMKVPVLAHNIRSRSTSNYIFMPDYHFLTTTGFQRILTKIRKHETPWDEKRPNIFWRGTTTGTSAKCAARNMRLELHPEEAPLNDHAACLILPRVDLVRRSLNISYIDAKISRASQCCKNSSNALSAMNLSGETVSQEYWPESRGIFDINGNANAWGMYWRLASGSAVFRVIEEDPWNNYYLNHTEPWVHYIPVKSDFSDFEKITSIAASEDERDIALLRRVAENAKSLMSTLNYDQAVVDVSRKLNVAWNRT